MGERHTLKLVPANRAKAVQGVDAAIVKGVAEGGKPWTLELRERTRTDDQNDALHGLIDQILKQRPHLCGVKMDKVRYKAVFMQALGHELVMLPTLDGSGFFPLGLSTSKLTVSEFTDLIEFVLAWCAEQGLTVEHFDGGRDREAAKNPSRRAA
jgi:hypothetical protein